MIVVWEGQGASTKGSLQINSKQFMKENIEKPRYPPKKY
jgi:hypothetical protein